MAMSSGGDWMELLSHAEGSADFGSQGKFSGFKGASSAQWLSRIPKESRSVPWVAAGAPHKMFFSFGSGAHEGNEV